MNGWLLINLNHALQFLLTKISSLSAQCHSLIRALLPKSIYNLPVVLIITRNTVVKSPRRAVFSSKYCILHAWQYPSKCVQYSVLVLSSSHCHSCPQVGCHCTDIVSLSIYSRIQPPLQLPIGYDWGIFSSASLLRFIWIFYALVLKMAFTEPTVAQFSKKELTLKDCYVLLQIVIEH